MFYGGDDLGNGGVEQSSFFYGNQKDKWLEYDFVVCGNGGLGIDVGYVQGGCCLGIGDGVELIVVLCNGIDEIVDESVVGCCGVDCLYFVCWQMVLLVVGEGVVDVFFVQCYYYVVCVQFVQFLCQQWDIFGLFFGQYGGFDFIQDQVIDFLQQCVG